MTADDQTRLEKRLLVLAPTGRDGARMCSVLSEAGIPCVVCPDLGFMLGQLKAGAGALLLIEEAIAGDGSRLLAKAVGRQPPWSDLPVLVLARPGADSETVVGALASLGNVTLLEVPVCASALVSAARAALRARARQYELRGRLEAQALLAAVVESSDDAIISKTLAGIITSWNTGAERLLGYSPAEAVGRPITFIIPPERHGEEQMILERLRRGERIEHYETVRLTKDGRPIDISLTISPIRDSLNRIVGASKVARDITQRKRNEESLREADRRRDEFLATLAHELRNPLAPIRNSLHILRLTGGDAPAAERVCNIMERQVNYMVRLVDDLLEVSRITRGQIELRRASVELAAIIRSAVEMSQPIIDAGRHQLAITLPREPLMLEADAVRLAQVFANLLNNAAKYMDEGGQIWLTARREGKGVAVSVRDTGMGIPAAMVPRVFEMFMQLDHSLRQAQGGLGIGLTMVHSLVEMHGGSVEARSEGPGKGSEFIVHLPLAEGPPPPAGTEREHRPRGLLPLCRVLVVDDNRDAADSLGMLLRSLGAEVQVVRDGLAALEAIESYRPAAVLLDIGMHGMAGYEVARRIRQQPEFAGITLIALSGWGQEEDRRRSRAAGFDHHLVKPVDVYALQALLASLNGAAGRCLANR